jgi:hypothetical protein
MLNPIVDKYNLSPKFVLPRGSGIDSNRSSKFMRDACMNSGARLYYPNTLLMHDLQLVSEIPLTRTLPQGIVVTVIHLKCRRTRGVA